MRRNIYDRLWQQRLRDEQRLEEERLLKEAQEADFTQSKLRKKLH
jgi:hypothetical protein